MNYFDHYFLFERNPSRKQRFELIRSKGVYEHFENVLLNKRNPNKGGLSLNFGERPSKWRQSNDELAITRNGNVSSVKRPDPNNPYSYGDIYKEDDDATNDACVMKFNEDFLIKGITTIEIFVSIGHKFDKYGLYQIVEREDVQEEFEELRSASIPRV